MGLLHLISDKNIKAIEDYFLNGGTTVLTDTQVKMMERCTFAHNRLLKMENEATVVKQVVTRFAVSTVTGYKVLAVTKHIFSFINPLDPKYYWQLIISWTIDAIKRARIVKDLKAEAMFQKNMIECLKNVEINDMDLTQIYNQYNVMIVSRPEDVGLKSVSDEVIETLKLEFAKKETI